MSYGVSAALQAAVYQRLVSDAALGALVGSDIFDMAPSGTVPALYVSLGIEDVRDGSDGSGGGAWHDLVISVVSETGGFQAAKDAAGAVSDALVDADLALARGRLVSLRFRRASARQIADGLGRRIDLWFRARVEDG